MTFRTVFGFRDSRGRHSLLDRKSIDIESLMVHDRIDHVRPFECEFCFTGYEHKVIRPEAPTGVKDEPGASILSQPTLTAPGHPA